MIESLEIFRDIHKGVPGFIVAPGPSLANWDINKIIKHGISFVCNGAMVAVDECDYFCLVDGIVPYHGYYNKAAKVAKNIIYCGGGNSWIYDTNKNGYGEEIEFNAKKYLIDRRYNDEFNVDLDVSICVRFDPTGLGIIGNINDNTLEEIWNSNKRNEWKNYHLAGKRYRIGLCSKCEFWGVPTGL